jgi:uncharacterized protein (DUF2141 family)
MYNLFIALVLLMVNSPQSTTSSMQLSVSGIEHVRGNLMIAIFDSEANFPADDKAIQRLVIPVTSKTQLIQLNGLVKGKHYAIALYHDENNNGKLDKNFLGIPTERYGFSNDARGTFGPPSWSEAKFLFQAGEKHQVILK